LFGLAPSPATLATIKIKKAAQLEPIMKQIQAVIASAPVKHLDETGFRIAGRTFWMHVSSTKTCTHDRADKRASLPEEMQGMVTHDYWKAYYKLTNVSKCLIQRSSFKRTESFD
jgi:transposase